MKKISLFILTLTLIFVICLSSCGKKNDNNKTTKSKFEVSTNYVIGLPNNSYSLNVSNFTGEKINLKYDEASWFNLTVKSNEEIIIKFNDEGKTTFDLTSDNYEAKTIDIECIDLKITNADDHIEVGSSQIIGLSKDVSATISVSNNSAYVTGNKVFAVEEDDFDVIVEYKGLVISKSFESYKRVSKLTNLSRNNKYINFFGRNVHQGDRVVMNNIGSGFEVTFYGTSLDATLNGWYGAWYGKTMVSILVDGETDTTKRKMTLTKGTTDTSYNLVKNLELGVHTIKVSKRTEGISTEMSLVDITCDGYFKKVDKTEKLKIEVYGDSITAGYGNLRGNIADTTSSQYQNGLQTYATYAASSLDALINVQARTGIGLYTASDIQDGYNCIDLYNYDTFEGVYEWNMNDYIPDIVIINLGTNDSWNSAKFNSEVFMSYYMEFIYTLAELYGSDTAFILCSGFMETTVKDYIEILIPYVQDNIDNPIYQITFDKCKGGHPLYEEHLEASKKLVNLIKENNLDVIHDHYTTTSFDDPNGENATYTLEVEVQDVFPDYCSLYVNGIGSQSIKLTKTTDFKYSATINAIEGDYEVSFNIDGNNDYYEVEYKKHIAHVRNNVTETIKINSFSSYPIDPSPYKETYGWTISKRLFEATLKTTSEDEIYVTNINWMAAFTYHRSNLKDNYELSAVIKSTVTGNVTEAYIGLLPYYLDDYNFVIIYLQFSSKGVLKSIGCTGQSNGTDIGWNDFWSFAGEKVDLDEGVSLSVIRSGTNLTVKLNGKTETKPINCMTSDNANYGVWTYGANTSFSDIDIKEAK